MRMRMADADADCGSGSGLRIAGASLVVVNEGLLSAF
jgi:hypothetical protein